jgi:hypothetical protein
VDMGCVDKELSVVASFPPPLFVDSLEFGSRVIAACTSNSESFISASFPLGESDCIETSELPAVACSGSLSVSETAIV